MTIEETTEVVITIGLRSPLHRWATVETPESRLKKELERLRKERYEVDLFVRGSWRRRWGRRHVVVFVETLWPDWRLNGADLVGGVILPSGTWMPATGKNPPPEIVLRGVRRTS